MMSFSGRMGGGYGRLAVEAKVVYTCFCVFMAIGYGSSAWLYIDDDLGMSADGVRAYYLGESAAPDAARGEHGHGVGEGNGGGDESGPQLDLPADLAATESSDMGEAAGTMRFRKPARQVMETFHFHLFIIPVVLMIVAHIYMMSRHTTRTKLAMIIACNGATLLHVLVPPLVRFGWPGFAGLMFPSAVVMTLTWAWMTLWPVYEMWTTAPADFLRAPL